MKQPRFFTIAAAICAGIAPALYFSQSAAAQTTGQKPALTAKPTPAVTPTPTPNGDDEVYKVETDLVNVNVRVVDRNNRPVTGLKQADFHIFEDGAPQKIEFFSQSEVPTNYSLVIDNSGSLRSQIDQVIEASKILVNSNKPADETSVIRFVSSDKIEILQDFTPSKADLNDALDNLYIEGGQTAIIDAVYLAANRVNEYEKLAKNKDDRLRRALVLVSDGEDVSSYYTQQQLFDLLRETDVQIYVVGFVNDLSKEKGFITKSKQGKAKSFLERLAAETGGKAYFPNDIGELNGIAQDIASELRTQYSIGYLPTNDRSDGTYRNLKVTINDGPNNQKRIAITRSGRTADTPGNSPGLKASAPATKPN
jgi:Ca-activated chloride channel family protein